MVQRAGLLESAKVWAIRIALFGITAATFAVVSVQPASAGSCVIDGTPVTTVASQAECDALVALYASTDGANWTRNTGWGTATDPCDWYGVSCDTSGITGLNLYGNELTGSIPPEIGNLTNLTWLNFAGGDLNRNHLSGAVPTEIGNLTNLTSLGLSTNQLTSIPPGIGNLTNLNHLALSKNPLTSIPPEIGNLTNLNHLGLAYARLTSLPSQIGNLAALESLSLEYNPLSSLPSELWKLTNLTWLDLTDTGLSSLPPEIESLTNLTSLLLSYNNLPSLPAEVGSLTDLKVLWINSNPLSSLPSELWKLTNLTWLDLTDTGLSSLPPEIENLTNLNHLGLAFNQLTSLPPEIGNLSNLVELGLAVNQLSSLPPEIGNLTLLTRLYLHRNMLSGDITAPMAGLEDSLTNLFLGDGVGGNNCMSVTDLSLAATLTALDSAWFECDALEGAGSVVFYDQTDGSVFMADVSGTGDRFNTPAVSGTITDADTVKAVYLGGPDPTVDDLLFYSSTTGRFQFASISAPDETGHRIDVFVDTNGTRAWTHVITGDYNGDGTTDILFYRASDGLMRFYTITEAGRFTPITEVMYGTRNWTYIIPGDFDGDGSDDVMWYRASDGLMRFYSVADSGRFFPITEAMFGTRNWTIFPSGDFNGDGSDDLMFYRGDGLARFYEVDATGTFRALGNAFRPSPGFTQIEAVELTPATPGLDLAWYHNGYDTLIAIRYDGGGIVNLWTPQSTINFGDDLIMTTGNFPR